MSGIEAKRAAHHLGYLRDNRFVVAAFHPDAGEVIWKDGYQSGFGGGGSDYYFRVLMPVAASFQADLTDQSHIGDEVLVLDRHVDSVYIAPRSCADEFLALIIGIEQPYRRCMCARPLDGNSSCNTCPAHRQKAPVSEVSDAAESPEDNGSS